MVLLLITLLFAGETAGAAGPLASACARLSEGDAALTKKCEDHCAYFEVKVDFVEACAKFNPDVNLRFRALNSGGDLETLKLCQSAAWSTEATLTCLRAGPTADIMKACRGIGAGEEDQVRCLRSGRDSAQVRSCTDLMPDPSGRFHCLEADMPEFEARKCGARNRATHDRAECVDDYASQREDPFPRDQLALKPSSVTGPAETGPGDEKNHRAPASR